jgi:hypothetical protein
MSSWRWLDYMPFLPQNILNKRHCQSAQQFLRPPDGQIKRREGKDESNGRQFFVNKIFKNVVFIQILNES